MWKIAYNAGILVALPFFAVLSLFKKKLRTNFLERLRPMPSDQAARGGIWVHAASIGEAVIAENIIGYFRQTEVASAASIVITTNTHYTRDLLRKKLRDSVEVFSAPLDLPLSIKRFLGKRRFDALLVIETELWPNTIWMARDRNIPVIIVNGRISDSTIGRYRRLSSLLRTLFASVDLILAQSDEHAERFISLGADPARVVVTGNLKYYRDVEYPSDSLKIGSVVAFGSVREKELPIVMSVIGRLKQELPDARFFVAPRELRLIDALDDQIPPGLTSCRYSRLKQSASDAPADIVIVDTIGDLVQVYAESTVAFVGGSLAPYGGQNLLEPLFVKTPVIFGPYTENFRTIAEEIVARKAGLRVRDGDELFSAINLVLSDLEKRTDLIDAGQAILDIQKGAMKKTANLILETIWKNSASSCS
jgi:3-deoxy-D-manno-octulosonic-acid transferase